MKLIPQSDARVLDPKSATSQKLTTIPAVTVLTSAYIPPVLKKTEL